MKTLCLLIALVCFSTAAVAGEKKRSPRTSRVFVIREFSVIGDLNEPDTKRLREETARVLSLHLIENGNQLVSEADVDKLLTRRGELRDCTTTRCNLEVAAELKAQRLVTLRLEQSSPRVWRIRLSVFNADSLSMRAKLDECDDCSARDLNDKQAIIAALKDLLHDDGPSELCTLRVTTIPAGADLSLDGQAVGVTPFVHTVEPGTRVFAIAEKHFAKVQQSVDCPAGRSANLTVKLDPVASVVQIDNPPVTVKKSRSPVLLGVGAAAVVAGVPLMGIGGALVSYNGKPGCDLAAGQRECPTRANTLGLGAGLLVPGVLLAAGGITLLVVDAIQRKNQGNNPPSVSVAPWISPSSVGLAIGGKL